jgi:FkbM family methyltransferase
MRFRYQPPRGEAIDVDLKGISDDDELYGAILSRGSFYELQLLEYAASLVGRRGHAGAVCIDVGANIGNHSVFFGKFLADFVVSVEPNPEVIPVLRRNLHANQVASAVYECALGPAEGAGRLVMPVGSEHNVGMARVEAMDGATDGAGRVRVRTLDAVLAEVRQARGLYGEVLLVKIDVEGAELDVLKGATETLSRDRPHLLVEAATADRQQQLVEYLAGLGYRNLSRWSNTPVFHYAFRPSAYLKTRVWAYRTWRRLKRRGRRR